MIRIIPRVLLSPKRSNCLTSSRICINSRSYASASGFNDYEEERRKWAPPAVPERLNFFSDVIEFWAHKEAKNERKGVPAFWYVGEDGKETVWSFQELSFQTRKASNVLHSVCGVKKGDRVILIVRKIPDLWVIISSLFQLGAVVSAGITQLRPMDIHYRINALQAKYIFADDDSAEKIDEIASSCPSIKRKIIVSTSDRGRKGWLDFRRLHKEAQPYHGHAKTRSTDPFLIFFTSGSTGSPKMVMHTMDSILSFRESGRTWMDLAPDHMICSVSDFGWAKSTWTSLLAPWSVGAGIFVHHSSRFDSKTSLKILQDYPITTFCAPPTAYRMLIQLDLRRYTFPRLRHCISAGEALDPAVNMQWSRDTGVDIYEGYGQTETPLLCAMYHCLKKKAGSMGKPPPGIHLTILDDNNNELGPSQEGRLAVKLKPHYPIGLFKEYLNNAEKTASAFLGDEYYLTGDRGYVDEEGYFWCVGRNDDIIISSGYTIGPFEVESALQEHPAVVESAVVRSPDELRGQIVKAFVVLHREYLQMDKTNLTKELQDHVKTLTSPYKYPRKIEFVSELPKTVSGKIQRNILRQKEWSNAKTT